MTSKLDYRINEKINPHTLAGTIMVLIGILAILNPIIFSYLMIYLIGIIFIIFGFIHGFVYFTTQGKYKLGLLESLVLIMLGFIDIISPFLGLEIFTAIAIIFFLFTAVSNFVLSRIIKSQMGSGIAILTGIFAIIAVVILVIGWPYVSYFFVGIFLGVVLIIDGIIFIMQRGDKRTLTAI